MFVWEDGAAMAENDDAQPSPLDAPSKRRVVDRRANFVDAHVGARVRQRRLALGYNLDELAERIGVGAQQLQKYETGANRISASRLYDIAIALGVPVAWFYQGIAASDADLQPPIPARPSAAPAIEQIPDLIGNFMQIQCSESRRALIELARILAAPTNKP